VTLLLLYKKLKYIANDAITAFAVFGLLAPMVYDYRKSCIISTFEYPAEVIRAQNQSSDTSRRYISTKEDKHGISSIQSSHANGHGKVYWPDYTVA
jgi:hypothetical protein